MSVGVGQKRVGLLEEGVGGGGVLLSVGSDRWEGEGKEDTYQMLEQSREVEHLLRETVQRLGDA